MSARDTFRDPFLVMRGGGEPETDAGGAWHLRFSRRVRPGQRLRLTFTDEGTAPKPVRPLGAGRGGRGAHRSGSLPPGEHTKQSRKPRGPAVP